MSVALRVDGVGKAFNQYRRERHRILSWFGFPIPSVERHWVLKDVCFALEPGRRLA